MKKLILSVILVAGFACLDAAAQKPVTAAEKTSTGQKSSEENRGNPAEINERNRQIAEKSGKIKRALEDGSEAYNAKNYELAIEKFDEGFRLDPDYAGSAPVFLNNKAQALRLLGAQKYNTAVTENRNPSLEANQYFLDSVATYKLAQRLLDEAEIPTDENLKRVFEIHRSNTARGLMESYQLLVLTDEARIYEAIEFFENYIKTETDESSRRRAEVKLKELKAKYKINY